MESYEAYRGFIKESFERYGYSVIVWIDRLAQKNETDIPEWLADWGGNYTTRGIPQSRWAAYGFAPLDHDLAMALQFKLTFGGQ